MSKRSRDREPPTKPPDSDVKAKSSLEDFLKKIDTRVEKRQSRSKSLQEVIGKEPQDNRVEEIHITDEDSDSEDEVIPEIAEEITSAKERERSQLADSIRFMMDLHTSK